MNGLDQHIVFSVLYLSIGIPAPDVIQVEPNMTLVLDEVIRDIVREIED